MAVLTEDTVRSLTTFAAADAPVTTCYLDVDGRLLPTHRDVERSFEHLVRRAGLTNGRAAEAHPSVLRDVERMSRYVQGFGRDRGARAIAMFSCSAADFWQVHELPVRVPSRLTVRHSPYVRPLEEVLDEYERFGVLLTDRQRARLFVFELGTLVEHTEQLDALVRQGSDSRGEIVKTRVDHQREEQAQQHLRHAAQAAFDLYRRVGFERFLLGAPADVAADVERHLHPYLRERLVERVPVGVGAPEADIRATALAAEERAERRAEARLLDQLREARGPKGKGAVGLAAVVEALNTQRVETLLVSASYSAEGWRCHSCDRLALLGRRCSLCGAEMVHSGDLAEDAVEMALTHQARVESLVGNADLDVLGGIGALLRY